MTPLEVVESDDMRELRLADERKRHRRAGGHVDKETRPLLGKDDLPETFVPSLSNNQKPPLRARRYAGIGVVPSRATVDAYAMIPQTLHSVVVQTETAAWPSLSELLLHGLSDDGTVALTLDVRTLSSEWTFGNGGERNTAVYSFLLEVAENINDEDPIASTIMTLQRSIQEVLTHSRRIDTRLYGRTNENGLCGYIMTKQLITRADSPDIDKDDAISPVNLWDQSEREAFILFLTNLPLSVRDHRSAGLMDQLIEWIRSQYPDEGHRPGGSPFLPRASTLWFNSQWLQGLVGRCTFQFYSSIDEYWPRGAPPFPAGHGMLHWDAGGERRYYSFTQLTQSLQFLNMAAIQDNHFFLLPTPEAGEELCRQMQAVGDLARKLVQLLQRQGEVILQWRARPTQAPISVDSDCDDVTEAAAEPSAGRWDVPFLSTVPSRANPGKSLGLVPRLDGITKASSTPQHRGADHTWWERQTAINPQLGKTGTDEALLGQLRERTLEEEEDTKDSDRVAEQGEPRVSSERYTPAAGDGATEHREVSGEPTASHRAGIG
jgi:hypothetical protein